MPSKLLIAAAGTAHVIDGSAGFGIEVAGRRIDGTAVMARVRRERDRFVGFVLDTVDSWPEAHRLQGRARFLAPGVLCVNDELRVNAARIVIATGATPNIPAGWRERLGDRLIVNDDVFDWTTLPDSVAVVGTGVVGLELAQALHRLGVRVRLFGRGGRAGPLTDPVMQSAVKAWLQTALPYSGNATDLDVRREGGLDRRGMAMNASPGSRSASITCWPRRVGGPPSPGLTWTRRAFRSTTRAFPDSIAPPAGSVIRPCSSPAMRTMITPCSTRPRTMAASPATPDAIPTFERRPAAPFEHRLHRPADGHGRSEPRGVELRRRSVCLWRGVLCRPGPRPGDGVATRGRIRLYGDRADGRIREPSFSDRTWNTWRICLHGRSSAAIRSAMHWPARSTTRYSKKVCAPPCRPCPGAARPQTDRRADPGLPTT
jgi:hypothetical protein